MAVVDVVFQSAWRVALPGMARLMEAGQEARELLERGTSFAAVAAGYTMVPLVATASTLVPALFGDGWDAAAQAIPYSAAGMMLAVPFGTVVSALLWARGDAGKVFVMGIPALIAALGTCAALAAPLGARAAGIGIVAGAIVFFLMSVYYAGDVFDRSAAARALIPVAVAGTAAAVGWAVTTEIPEQWAAIVAGGIVSLIVYTVLLGTVERPALLRLVGLMRRVLARVPAAAT
jgi:O-antigen/teichoic acid export membrane protein